MADISITAANVGIGSATTVTQVVQAGESVTQGQPVYRSTSTGKYLRADNNDTLAKSLVEGIAVTAASTDGFFLMVSDGQINLGATLGAGTIYVVSSTVGGIAPAADIATGNYVTILGTASTSSVLDIAIKATGIQKA